MTDRLIKATTALAVVTVAAVAALKSWRILRKLRCSPARTTGLVQAILCLHLASSD